MHDLWGNIRDNRSLVLDDKKHSNCNSLGMVPSALPRSRFASYGRYLLCGRFLRER